MAQNRALIVGLKHVDPSTHNAGWNGSNGTSGAELDVDNMVRILGPLGFSIQTLKTSSATHDAILGALRQAAQETRPGELFCFYYSGHGGQQPDFKSNKIDESDGEDETLVAYDKDIIDDDLDDIWCSFAEGSCIFMISDSCNSGTNYKGVPLFRAFTPIIPIRSFEVKASMRAQMIHLGGTRDGMNAKGYPKGGLFTQALCHVWNNGAFQGNYRSFLASMVPLVEKSQQPAYNEYGPVTNSFRNAKPFHIG